MDATRAEGALGRHTFSAATYFLDMILTTRKQLNVVWVGLPKVLGLFIVFYRSLQELLLRKWPFFERGFYTRKYHYQRWCGSNLSLFQPLQPSAWMSSLIIIGFWVMRELYSNLLRYRHRGSHVYATT